MFNEHSIYLSTFTINRELMNAHTYTDGLKF